MSRPAHCPHNRGVAVPSFITTPLSRIFSTRPRQALLLSLIGLGAFSPFSSLGIDSDWVKRQIVERVSRSLEADLKVDRLVFNPLSGTAQLEGVEFVREGSNNAVEIDIDQINLNLKILPLFGEKLHFQDLDIASPTVKFRTWPPTGPPPERPPRPAMRFERFTIEGGEVEIAVEGTGPDPFVASATDIQYAAKDIDLSGVKAPVELFYGADVETTFDINGPVELAKDWTPQATTIELRGVDMAYLDRHFGRGKPFAVTRGSFDIEGRLSGGQVVQHMIVRGLELKPTPAGAYGATPAEATYPAPPGVEQIHPTEIPPELTGDADALLAYVEQTGGDFEFTVAEADKSLLPGRDLHAFLRWWWLQVWRHLAEEAAAGGSLGDLP